MNQRIIVTLLVLGLLPFNLQAVEDNLKVEVLYLGQESSIKKPLSLVEQVVEEGGLGGIKLAMNDNATTGAFIGHQYHLNTLVLAEEFTTQQIVDAVNKTDEPYIIADLPAQQLLSVVDNISALPERLFFNVRDKSVVLREKNCRSHVLHMIPDRAMLADALAQYLLTKRWTKWLLIEGKEENDRAFADAIEAAAKKFKTKIVSRETWRFEYGGRLVDSGHVSAKQEVPLMTQGEGKDYDVIVVADEGDNFGEYIPYQSFLPRPVVGTQGLIATSWHRVNELWGATQIQRRFSKLADGRYMTEGDYAAWAAGRSIGEAVTRLNSVNLTEVRSHLLSDKFGLAAFKGVALNFRNWNGQLRQPVLLAAPKMLVSVSPQPGFLHQFNPLDTLGLDKSQTECDQFGSG